MAPKRVAVESPVGESAKRRKVPDSKKKPADNGVLSGAEEEPTGESLPAFDDPDADADGDDGKKDAGDSATDAIVPVKQEQQDTPGVLAGAIVAVKPEPVDEEPRRIAKKGEGMNPLDVSRMLSMLKKRTKSKDR